MRVLLVGHGRMGRLIEEMAHDHGCQIAGTIDIVNAADLDGSGAGGLSDVDVAIDFSTSEAFAANLPKLAARHVNVVVGTTGWQAFEAEARRIVADAEIGLVAAPNCSPGVNLFEAVVARAAALFSTLPEYGAWIHEAHHAAKRDAPSGTALMLERAMRESGYNRPIDVASTRAGSIPGTHTIGFDAPAETITLTHTARDRSAFAHGALLAARWVEGKRGWFTMKDVLGLR